MKLFLTVCLIYITCIASTQAYIFGLKSFDNSLENITDIEKKYDLDVPMIALILDPYIYGETLQRYKNIETLSGKVFHITVSPGMRSAQQVARGDFDEEYREFFAFVKKKQIKVVFRTMHEMNGNRYPRAGNAYRFRKARKHIWEMSRDEGLDQQQILFDFSLNHRDVATIKKTSTRCYYQDTRNGCKTWEQFYPGDEYVDILGFTFYNRGRATFNREWIWPEDILIRDGAGLLERLQAKKKPVFIDEVGTTKVRYNDKNYDFARSQEVFRDNKDTRKNLRLSRLATFVAGQPWIRGMIYFNIDYTAGLNHELKGEADRAVIDLSLGKFYESVRELFQKGEDIYELEKLFQ